MNTIERIEARGRHITERRFIITGSEWAAIKAVVEAARMAEPHIPQGTVAIHEARTFFPKSTLREALSKLEGE